MVMHVRREQGGAISISHLEYRHLEKEESRVIDSQICELRIVKCACAKAQLWLHGEVRLTQRHIVNEIRCKDTLGV
jgi:hypothetical protein